MQNPAMSSHLDPQLEDRILHEVKSQGVFDEFRKDSMADVDTKPAYQNLRQRVENTVKKFLSEQQWTPDMNKNQLREKLRRHITEAGFLDVGVERIVDQVVNPKISTVFQPRIEEITYKYLGLPPPPKHEPPPPIMHPLPPLPLTGQPLQIDTSSLLPTGLEQVSPDSDKATVKSECREDDQSVMDMDIDTDGKLIDDDDESPPFEPLVKCEEADDTAKADALKKSEEGVEAKPLASTPKKESLLNEKPTMLISSVKKDLGEIETQDTSGSANISDPEPDKIPRISTEADAMISQDSQLSQVSSDSHISDVTPNASHSFRDDSSPHIAPQTISDQTEAAMELASANISEEAQMPKFNENSSEVTDVKPNVAELHFDIKKDEIKFEGTERKYSENAGEKSIKSELHFDIKKDEIKFQGTDRKSSLLEQERESNSVTENDNTPDQNITLSRNSDNKGPPHHFRDLKNEANVEPIQTKLIPNIPAVTLTPTPHDSSFGSSLEDTSNQLYADHFKNGIKSDYSNAANSVFSTPMQALSDRKETSAAENWRSSSSSRHKKHSKDKRRSRESNEKHKDRERSKKKYKSKDKDKDRDESRSRDKSRHKDKERRSSKDSERKEKDRRKDKERPRTEHKHYKSKNDGTERSSSSKRPSSITGLNTSSSKYEKSGSAKHSNSLASHSSSSSRSESLEARREKRDSDKKKHRSSSSNGTSSKKVDTKSESSKTQTAVDDHNIEKTKLSKRRSTDSNDEDKGGGGANGSSGRSERERKNLNSNGTTYDKQQDQQKETKNAYPISQSPKGKAKSGLLECGEEEKHTNNLITVDKVCEATSAEELTAQSHKNKVVILNDMLEDPNIHFIDLGPKADITPPKMPMSEYKKIQPTHLKNSPGVEKNQLLFFEELNAQFTDRLRLLDNAMDRCRRVVNNLRFDCANGFCDGFETLEEHQSKDEMNDNISPKTCATITVDCVSAYAVDDCFRRNEKSRSTSVDNTVNSAYGLTGKRKRGNNGQLIHSKPSPTLSDASVNSKENVAMDKNGEEVKCVRRITSVNKLSQQRYNSEDLYKPRPVLSQRSRRRGMDTII